MTDMQDGRGRQGGAGRVTAAERLHELIAEHRQQPLPATSGDPDLDDIHALLVLYDGRVAGVANSVVAGAPVDRSDLEPDAALASRIATADPLLPGGEEAVRRYEAHRRRLDALLDASRLALDSRSTEHQHEY